MEDSPSGRAGHRVKPASERHVTVGVVGQHIDHPCVDDVRYGAGGGQNSQADQENWSHWSALCKIGAAAFLVLLGPHAFQRRHDEKVDAKRPELMPDYSYKHHRFEVSLESIECVIVELWVRRHLGRERSVCLLPESFPAPKIARHVTLL